MIRLKTSEDIENLKEGGNILAKILNLLAAEVKAGVQTWDLEVKALDLIQAHGATPSFLGYRGFPTALCLSVNDEIVHAVPSERRLQEGDVVKLDLGVWHKNLATDSALTVVVGENVKPETAKLVAATSRALELGIAAAQPGNHVGDIGYVIEKEIKSAGLVGFPELCGHGVGFEVHESPLVPNFGKPKEGVKLKEGMVLAIEPMAGLFGSGEIIQSSDGFGYKSKEGSPAAHFEHTVAVTKDGPVILTKEI